MNAKELISMLTDNDIIKLMNSLGCELVKETDDVFINKPRLRFDSENKDGVLLYKLSIFKYKILINFILKLIIYYIEPY